jgi:hypothetical protein
LLRLLILLLPSHRQAVLKVLGPIGVTVFTEVFALLLTDLKLSLAFIPREIYRLLNTTLLRFWILPCLYLSKDWYTCLLLIQTVASGEKGILSDFIFLHFFSACLLYWQHSSSILSTLLLASWTVRLSLYPPPAIGCSDDAPLCSSPGLHCIAQQPPVSSSISVIYWVIIISIAQRFGVFLWAASREPSLSSEV